MSQSLTVEWLNENEYRAYPLRFLRNREVLIVGRGRISPGAYDATVGGYLMNGVADTSVSPAVLPAFRDQISPGDLLQINGTRGAVLFPADERLFTQTSLYASTTWFPSSRYQYLIVKQNFSPDTDNTADVNFEGFLLDANLIYNTTPMDMSVYGKLLQAYPLGSSLVIEVGGQALFTIPNYLAEETVYPHYVRNTDGSLLVIGATAKAIVTPWSFVNCFFEPSVITRMDRAWRGVTSLTFNGSSPVDGDVKFTEGYQVGLSALTASNTLKITAGKGLGKPIGCDRIFGDDVPADCSSLLSFINGAYARTDFGELDLIAGSHIAIYPDPDRHRIYIGLTFNEDDICKTLPSRPVSQI